MLTSSTFRLCRPQALLYMDKHPVNASLVTQHRKSLMDLRGERVHAADEWSGTSKPCIARCATRPPTPRSCDGLSSGEDLDPACYAQHQTRQARRATRFSLITGYGCNTKGLPVDSFGKLGQPGWDQPATQEASRSSTSRSSLVCIGIRGIRLDAGLHSSSIQCHQLTPLADCHNAACPWQSHTRTSIGLAVTPSRGLSSSTIHSAPLPWSSCVIACARPGPDSLTNVLQIVMQLDALNMLLLHATPRSRKSGGGATVLPAQLPRGVFAEVAHAAQTRAWALKQAGKEQRSETTMMHKVLSWQNSCMAWRQPVGSQLLNRLP
jgi:hypothetical protein